MDPNNWWPFISSYWCFTCTVINPHCMVVIQGYSWNLSQLYSYGSWFGVDSNLLYMLPLLLSIRGWWCALLVPSQKSGLLEGIWLCILMKYITNVSKPCPVSYYILFHKLTSQFTVIWPIHCCLFYRVCFSVEVSFLHLYHV